MADTGQNLRQRQPQNSGNEQQNGVSSPNVDNQNIVQNTWNPWTNFQAPGSSESAPTSPQYRTSTEYAQAVQQWLWHCQWVNSMNWFHMNMNFYAMSFASMQHAQSRVTQVSSNSSPGPAPAANPVRRTPGPAQPAAHQPAAQNQAQGARQPNIGREFLLPSLWKRILAEFIDFALLFIIKLAITIATVEYVGFIDLQRYDIDNLFAQDIDYETAFQMTSELIAMEIINRIFICVFETLCLQRGVGGMIGGATPGKRLLGLRVVSCEDIIELPRQRVRVVPAGDIGFWNALVRSVIKNFSLAFFFPVCFTVFFFQHNRAAYDVISCSLVVEVTAEDQAAGR